MLSKNYSLFTLLLSLSVMFQSCKASQPMQKDYSYPTQYEVSMLEPANHYFDIKMTVNLSNTDFGNEFIEVKMPVWTPGSYLVREFARNVESLRASNGNINLDSRKTSKNTWRIQTQGLKIITINYRVYANELSVRTSHLDASHGYINGASVFMYVPQLMKEKHSVKINPHESFKKISVGLAETSKNTFQADNYDLLVDSFFEIGNQDVLTFEYEGITHTIANYSVVPLNYDAKVVTDAYKKVVKAAHDVIGGTHPCKNYLFVVHHLPNIGGGLEHLNGTTCQTSPDIYQNQEKFTGFLGLIAHEYFHLWNVKRLRPVALGPFDYENENYTNMLWVSEGFTAYYQEDILRRAGIIDIPKYISTLLYDINSTENAPGNKVQSVAESSWDAWIKYYRPNENSNNSTISYYNRGSVMAGVLNAMIIDKTGGEKSMDDVLRMLYQDFYLKRDIGFTDNEFREACEKVSGLDLKTFFADHIFGTKTIDFVGIYSKIGVDASLDNSYAQKPSLGANIRGNMVSRVDMGGSFLKAGLNSSDMITKVNGLAFAAGDDMLSGKSNGDVLKIEAIRNGKPMSFEVKLLPNPAVLLLLKEKSGNSGIELKKFNKFFHVK
jgi:predicted metalloprotease with PDZ domain